MSLTIALAKAIPLKNLVEHLGGRYSHTDRQGDTWYFSPFRPDEKTASFKVNEKLNTWHDFGLSNTFAHKNQGSGGDSVDLWCDYHFEDRRTGVPKALKALEEFAPAPLDLAQRQNQKAKLPVQEKKHRYRIIEIKERIIAKGLIAELDRRRINIQLADRYLKQGHIIDDVNGKNYTGFLFENDAGGFEVSIPNPSRNECFKTCIGPKASTRLMASDDQSAADVFEGFFDFLSWLEINGYERHENHTYVLNSVSLVSEVCDKIVAFNETIKDVFLFMDNDNAGRKANEAIITTLVYDGIKVGSYEDLYQGRKDLSEYWVKGPTTEVLKFKD